MLAILSPAKTLDFETPPCTPDHSLPEFLDDSEQLIEQLRELSPDQVSELMHISEKLGILNANRFLDWQLPFTPSNSKQAILAFKGDVYAGLQAEQMDADDLAWAQDHVRILSGLYGVLKPLDLIQPYRLEMGTRFNNSRGDQLYRFWGEKLTDSLNYALLEDRHEALVNLASDEYFKAVQPKRLKAPVIKPIFKDWKNGKYKVISFFAKKARGLMSRYIIQHKLTNPEDIKHFDAAGYSFDTSASTQDTWIFTRDNPENV